MTRFIGKPTEHWLSIYQLAVFRGCSPKSLWDLIDYSKSIMPESPNDCLKIGLELIEAKATVDTEHFYGMLDRFVFESRAELNQKKYGVSHD